ncbi:MAG: hypothetical protein H0W90_16205 [Actinobacteria bacterium]|nr:hypothetical protein [Actinomycetota bacterium]
MNLDLLLVELEQRLLKYAQAGASLLEMADEGLLLAARSSARLAQAQSAASHTHSHLQLVGVGEWEPVHTQPAWNSDPRITADDDRLADDDNAAST